MTHSNKIKHIHNVSITILNILIVIIILFLFLNHLSLYRQKIRTQNINEIVNLNHSATMIGQSIFTYQAKKLQDIRNYININTFTEEEALTLIQKLNSDPTCIFEIIDTKNKGYASIKDPNGKFTPISYAHFSYDKLQEIFTGAETRTMSDVSYTPQFTDAFTAFNSLGLYTSIYLTTDISTRQVFTLLCVSESDSYVNIVDQNCDFEGFSTVFIDSKGDYIIGNNDFKGNNFFKYLYVFNNLTLDQQNSLTQEVYNTQHGNLYYKNSEGDDCIFIYSRLANKNWYAVSSVPLSSFHNTQSDVKFSIVIALLLCLLMTCDLFWLAHLNTQLKKSIKSEQKANEAKTEFLSRMSHDMRTPLNAVLGFTALSKENTNLPANIMDNLNKIDLSGHYLLSLINDVLDMSKIESGKIELHNEPVNCKNFLIDIETMFTGEAQRKKLMLVTEFNIPTTLNVRLDPLRTRQIFSNLLSNAIKFSDSGKTIIWKATSTPLDSETYLLTTSISDQGCGMSKEFMSHLFEPFMQEQNKHSNESTGTGLGLTIVKRLIDLMHGTISYESEKNKGTSFTITIPQKISTEEKSSLSQQVNYIDNQILKGKRVLLCEDNELNQQIAQMLLNEKSVTCELADNGQLGMEMFNKSPPKYYDAILMDIRMPIMDGIEATKAIRSLDHADAKRIPIIAMTANAYDEDVRTTLEAGMNAHVAKPIEPERLYGVLSVLIRDSNK